MPSIDRPIEPDGDETKNGCGATGSLGTSPVGLVIVRSSNNNDGTTNPTVP